MVAYNKKCFHFGYACVRLLFLFIWANELQHWGELQFQTQYFHKFVSIFINSFSSACSDLSVAADSRGAGEGAPGGGGNPVVGNEVGGENIKKPPGSVTLEQQQQQQHEEEEGPTPKPGTAIIISAKTGEQICPIISWCAPLEKWGKSVPLFFLPFSEAITWLLLRYISSSSSPQKNPGASWEQHGFHATKKK